MNGQLIALDDEYRAASERLHALATVATDVTWRRRPAPDRWSSAECVAHLVLTSRAFVPLLHRALDEARHRGGPAPASYRRDMAGWIVGVLSGATRWFPLKTTPGFVPVADQSMAALLAEFDQLQADHRACLRAADGLPMHQVKLQSPFDARLHYSLFSAFAMIPGHQQRHLHQAEQAALGG